MDAGRGTGGLPAKEVMVCTGWSSGRGIDGEIYPTSRLIDHANPHTRKGGKTVAIQGISSITVDYEGGSEHYIRSDWPQDILNLGARLPTDQRPLDVRTTIIAKPWDKEVNVDLYNSILRHYRDRTPSIPVSGVIGLQFRPATPSLVPNGPLWADGLNSDYINDFSNRAADHAARMWNDGLRGYFVWNEPNNTSLPEAYLNNDRFAAMLYQTYWRVKAMAPGMRVMMGGILWPANAWGDPAAATTHVYNTLQAVYNHLSARGALANGVPWDAVNVHVHHRHNVSEMQSLRAAINAAIPSYHQKPIVVGEWGLASFEWVQGGAMLETYG